MLRIRRPRLYVAGTPQQLAAEASVALTAAGALTVRKHLAGEASIGAVADGALTVGPAPATGEIITTRRRRR